jgi:hypothetical protein
MLDLWHLTGPRGMGMGWAGGTGDRLRVPSAGQEEGETDGECVMGGPPLGKSASDPGALGGGQVFARRMELLADMQAAAAPSEVLLQAYQLMLLQVRPCHRLFIRGGGYRRPDVGQPVARASRKAPHVACVGSAGVFPETDASRRKCPWVCGWLTQPGHWGMYTWQSKSYVFFLTRAEADAVLGPQSALPDALGVLARAADEWNDLEQLDREVLNKVSRSEVEAKGYQAAICFPLRVAGCLRHEMDSDM